MRRAAYGVHWPSLLPSDLCHSEVTVSGRMSVVDNTPPSATGPVILPPTPDLPPAPTGPTVRAPLGRVMGGRSGDKGGNANLGVWVRTPLAFAWLRQFLTVDRLAVLFPEAREHAVERHELPNLLALNFVFSGLLQEGVAASVRMDPQAKGLAEYVRARVVDIPRILLPESTA